jgi:hypothetical protein
MMVEQVHQGKSGVHHQCVYAPDTICHFRSCAREVQNLISVYACIRTVYICHLRCESVLYMVVPCNTASRIAAQGRPACLKLIKPPSPAPASPDSTATPSQNFRKSMNSAPAATQRGHQAASHPRDPCPALPHIVSCPPSGSAESAGPSITRALEARDPRRGTKTRTARLPGIAQFRSSPTRPWLLAAQAPVPRRCSPPICLGLPGMGAWLLAHNALVQFGVRGWIPGSLGQKLLRS